MRSQISRPSSTSWTPVHGAALCLPPRTVVRSSACRRTAPGRILCAASGFALSSPSQFPVEADAEAGPRAFPYPLPMSAAQRTLSSIPLFLFFGGAAAAMVGLAYGVGMLVKTLPLDPTPMLFASWGAAIITGAAALIAALHAKKVRDSVAIVELYNHLVTLPEPHCLSYDTVKDIGTKYGINMQRDEPEGLRKVYGQMLETIIPSGENQLRGDEADKVRSFKEALGLADEDAAPVHLEVGRRLNRQGYETKDRQQQFEQRKAFQRLMYVSQIVFGDQKSAFLLPWRRTFNLTDAQLFVARRDNAAILFKRHIELRGGHIQAERHFLRELRQKQVAVKMLDESATEMVKEYTRKHVEGLLDKALAAARATGKNRDVATAITTVRQVLDYSRALSKYSSEDDLIPGLGQVTLVGGPWAGDAKLRDVKELYKLYIDEQLAKLGTFAGELERDARELQAVLGLRALDAQALQDEVAAKIYRKLLREAVTSKRLENSPSPASVLQELCQKVRFSSEGAAEFHKLQYKTKVTNLIDKGRLSDEDLEELKKIRRMLCIPQDVANQVMRDTAGKALEEVLTDVFMMGPKPILDIELSRIDSIMQDLKLDPEVAVEVLGQVARERFNSYVQSAQKAGDRAGVAAPLKKMVQFNMLVVTPLLDRIRGVTSAAASGEAEVASSSSSDDPVAAARKAMQERRSESSSTDQRGQREINLRDMLQAEMRAELYKNYLMQSMSAEVVDLPVGGSIRKKSNEAGRQAEMTRLQAVADILGMNQMEIAQVHQGLGEQAYKQQALEALRAGPIGEQTVQYLDDMRQQLGLPKEAADRILKQARAEVYGSSNATAEEGGRWTLERVMAMAKNGTPADALMEEPNRRNIYRREVEQKLLDGTGDVDPEYIKKTLPELLVISDSKVRMTLKELAGSRKRRELVQAVSQIRQRRLNDVVTSLQNLLSCSRVLPDEAPMAWSDREELKNVFALYCNKETNETKQSLLQGILGLSETEAEDARASPLAGGAGLSLGAKGQATEEEDSFW